jgi:hypothetical protein
MERVGVAGGQANVLLRMCVIYSAESCAYERACEGVIAEAGLEAVLQQARRKAAILTEVEEATPLHVIRMWHPTERLPDRLRNSDTSLTNPRGSELHRTPLEGF